MRIVQNWIRKGSNLSMLNQEQPASTPLTHVAVLGEMIPRHDLPIRSPVQNNKSEPAKINNWVGNQSSSNHKSMMSIQISSASATTWARSVERRLTRSLETIPLSGWIMSEATGIRIVGTNTATSCMMLWRLRPFPPIVYFLAIDGLHPIFTISVW